MSCDIVHYKQTYNVVINNVQDDSIETVLSFPRKAIGTLAHGCIFKLLNKIISELRRSFKESNDNTDLTFVITSERNSDPLLLFLTSSIEQKSFMFPSSLSATGMQ